MSETLAKASVTEPAASEKPAPALKLNFLSHGTLDSRDLAFARKFYEEFLGFDVVQTSPISLLIKLGGNHTIAVVYSKQVGEMNLLNHNGIDVRTKEEVEEFYDFWYNFDSWRTFEYLDEDVPDDNEGRDHKRHIEKKNANARRKRKTEDTARLRKLVDDCLGFDERIKKFRKAASADKNKKRLEKEAAAKRDSPDRREVTGLSGNMDQHDRLSLGRKAALEIGRIHIEAAWD